MTTETLTRPTVQKAAPAPMQAKEPTPALTVEQENVEQKAAFAPAAQQDNTNVDAMPLTYRIASYAVSVMVVGLIALAHFNQALQMVA